MPELMNRRVYLEFFLTKTVATFSMRLFIAKHYPPPRNNRFAFNRFAQDVQNPRRLSRRGSVVKKPDFVLLSLAG